MSPNAHPDGGGDGVGQYTMGSVFGVSGPVIIAAEMAGKILFNPIKKRIKSLK